MEDECNPFLTELESNIVDNQCLNNDNNEKGKGSEFINFSVNPKEVEQYIKSLNEKYNERDSILKDVIFTHNKISVLYTNNHKYEDKKEKNNKIINDVIELADKIKQIQTFTNNLNKKDS